MHLCLYLLNILPNYIYKLHYKYNRELENSTYIYKFSIQLNRLNRWYIFMYLCIYLLNILQKRKTLCWLQHRVNLAKRSISVLKLQLHHIFCEMRKTWAKIDHLLCHNQNRGRICKNTSSYKATLKKETVRITTAINQKFL